MIQFHNYFGTEPSGYIPSASAPEIGEILKKGIFVLGIYLVIQSILADSGA